MSDIFSEVSRVSSEDPAFPASNILKSDSAGKWMSAKNITSDSIEVDLLLEKEVQISSIDIGNCNSHTVEFLVAHSLREKKKFNSLVPAFALNSVQESKQYLHEHSVSFVKEEMMSFEVRQQQWDILKIVCRQPYNSQQFGLSFVSVKVKKESDNKSTTTPLRDVSNNQKNLHGFFTGGKSLFGELPKIQKKFTFKKKPYLNSSPKLSNPTSNAAKTPKAFTDTDKLQFLSELDCFFEEFVNMLRDGNNEVRALRLLMEKQRDRPLNKHQKKLFLEVVTMKFSELKETDMLNNHSSEKVDEFADILNTTPKHNGDVLFEEEIQSYGIPDNLCFTTETPKTKVKKADTADIMDITKSNKKYSEPLKSSIGDKNNLRLPKHLNTIPKLSDGTAKCQFCAVSLPDNMVESHKAKCSKAKNEETKKPTRSNRNRLLFDMGQDDQEDTLAQPLTNNAEEDPFPADFNDFSVTSSAAQKSSTPWLSTNLTTPLISSSVSTNVRKTQLSSKTSNIRAKPTAMDAMKRKRHVVSLSDDSDEDLPKITRELKHKFQSTPPIPSAAAARGFSKTLDFNRNVATNNNQHVAIGNNVVEETQECPVCFCQIEKYRIGIHASICDGPPLASTSTNNSSPLNNISTSKSVNCPICNKAIDADIIDVHVNHCIDSTM